MFVKSLSKRRGRFALAILLALTLVFTMMPLGASAAGSDVTAQAAGDVTVRVSLQMTDAGFEIAPTQEVKVHPGLAAEYGYSYESNVKSTDITALDALVAASILYYGSSDADLIKSKLSYSGWIASAFDFNSTGFLTFVNGQQPNDGVAIPDTYNGGECYTGYAPGGAVIKKDDLVSFYAVQDTAMWADNFVWFEKDGKKTDGFKVEAGDSISLTVKGYMNWYCLSVPSYSATKTEPIADAAFVSAKIEKGAWEKAVFESPISVSEKDGVVKFTAPTKPGTYYYSAFDKSKSAPMISPWLKLTVEKHVKLSFNANGGKVKTSSKTVSYDAKYGTLPTPTKSLKAFAGWYTKKSGGTKVTATGVVKLEKNATVYAHWTNQKAKLTKNAKLLKSASAKAKSVSSLKKGKSVELLKKKGSWYQVKVGGKTGWVEKKNLKI